MAENSSSNLSAEQKLEIGSYVGSLIKGWLTWIGIANLAVLGGAIVYIFFILPGEAITEATNRIERKISQAITNLSEQANTNLVKFGDQRRG
ncbi:hypothetical protein [Candidatus Thiosymbion oneisti]|uniref:hypothetical protein n=1 Tax=Candidatus Thiosymbion oneisti TaxID=589554 RepID=UPI00105C3A01|nr:hypothetical protein [Candidatus Thiosymbion oneisti]